VIGRVKVTKGILIEFDFVDKAEAARIFSCHPKTVEKYRKEQAWIEKIHFVAFGGKILYNRQLLLNLVQCGGEVMSEEHQRAIAFYLANRLDNQSLPRKRK